MIKAINRSIAARHEEDEKGFTLIELLVVILIIGVLAAIAIPAFLNQREGAWEAQAKSDIANATLAVESWSVDQNGSYTGVATAPLGDFGYNATPRVTVTPSEITDGFQLVATHLDLPTKSWTYNSTTGVTTEGAVTP